MTEKLRAPWTARFTTHPAPDLYRPASWIVRDAENNRIADCYAQAEANKVAAVPDMVAAIRATLKDVRDAAFRGAPDTTLSGETIALLELAAARAEGRDLPGGR